LYEVLEEQKIAYFSMEIGLSNDVPTYSGGLGVLAGDTIRSSADLKLPLVAVTLVSKKGYFKQEITKDGRQIEHPQEWDPSKLMKMLPSEVTVRIQNRDVRIKAWLYEVKSLTGGLIPVLFLDTDVDGNSPEDRAITFYLYGGVRGRRKIQIKTRDRSWNRRRKNARCFRLQSSKIPHE
jgi:starch phosphorylase